METVAHWTQYSMADFIHSISSNFVAQIETKIEVEGISQNEIASRMNKTSGRVSQVLNNPGNLSIRVMVELARSLGMKVSIIAYDDKDPNNDRGPINPDVFVKSWEKLNCPIDLFEVEEAVLPVAELPVARWGMNPSLEEDFIQAIQYAHVYSSALPLNIAIPPTPKLDLYPAKSKSFTQIQFHERACRATFSADRQGHR